MARAGPSATLPFFCLLPQNGKDNGAGIEFSWIVDDRNRNNTALTAMAGERRARWLLLARAPLTHAWQRA
jgi:hypothetical protein